MHGVVLIFLLGINKNSSWEIRCQKPLEDYLDIFSDDIFISIFGLSLMQINKKSCSFKSSFCQ